MAVIGLSGDIDILAIPDFNHSNFFYFDLLFQLTLSLAHALLLCSSGSSSAFIFNGILSISLLTFLTILPVSAVR